MLQEKEKSAIAEHYRIVTQNLPNFRPRKAQREMLAHIANALARSREDGFDEAKGTGENIAVIEAPTGVGKSLAYLLAGGIMAQMRDKKLIVASATVALQEQLINRDLPLVIENSGLSLSYAIAKGRGRYLCPYKLYQITQTDPSQQAFGFLLESKPDQQESTLLHEMAQRFANREFNGDRDSWTEKLDDKLWQKITSDRFSCLKNTCPNREECPFYLARDVLDEVDVIVTNHDLLLTDINMGGGVILPHPSESFYCLDEAHHLPKKALKQFSAEHSLNVALMVLESLPRQTTQIALYCDDVGAIDSLEQASVALLESLNEWYFVLQDNASLQSEEIWIWQDGVVPEQVETLVQNCWIAVQQLYKQAEVLNEFLAKTRKEQFANGDSTSLDKISSEYGIFVARIQEIFAVWHLMATVVRAGSEPLAKWISLDNKKGDFHFHASPINASDHLLHHFWLKTAGAILTSATLRSLGKFDLFLRQTGLNMLPDVRTEALDSPFNYPQQGQLYLPPISASPKNPPAHTQAVVQWLPKLISLTDAVGTLVLFGSKKQMLEVADGLPENLRELLLIQGEMAKSQLLAQHHQRIAQQKASVIFGLDSFAEGLDLPLHACVQVIIVKLPFSMPDDPIEKTRSRWIEQKGGNPFLEITVPEASIKLIQAVGRLIRTEQDYGRVTILDNRILTQGYGRQMLACLPPLKRL